MAKVMMRVGRLVQITGATGSQIRMEIWASSQTEMARYFWEQAVQAGLSGQMDLIAIDQQDRFGTLRPGPKIKELGVADGAATANWLHKVDDLTGGAASRSASLKFAKSIQDKFVATLELTQKKGDPDIFTLGLKGKLGKGLFGLPIPGKLFVIKGTWPWLIDL